MPLRIPKPDFDPMVRLPRSLRRAEAPPSPGFPGTRWVDATKPAPESQPEAPEVARPVLPS
jgi:hypothetical protein